MPFIPVRNFFLLIVIVSQKHTFLTFRWPCIVINSLNKTNSMHWFLKFIFGIKLYMFQTVLLSIIRSFSLYTQQWYMSYSLRAGSRQLQFHPDPARKLSANLYVLLCVQWKIPDDGQRNCLKHVEFYFKNKFEKLVHLHGLIIRTHILYCWRKKDQLDVTWCFISLLMCSTCFGH